MLILNGRASKRRKNMEIQTLENYNTVFAQWLKFVPWRHESETLVNQHHQGRKLAQDDPPVSVRRSHHGTVFQPLRSAGHRFKPLRPSHRNMRAIHNQGVLRFV